MQKLSAKYESNVVFQDSEKNLFSQDSTVFATAPNYGLSTRYLR